MVVDSLSLSKIIKIFFSKVSVLLLITEISSWEKILEIKETAKFV
jgi:hypothetical protein